MMQLRKCDEDYGAEAFDQHTAFVGESIIGDLVEFSGPYGYCYRAILTFAMQPYSNGLFATRDGALNYLKAVAVAKGIV